LAFGKVLFNADYYEKCSDHKRAVNDAKKEE
jgi:hypothetical protein